MANISSGEKTATGLVLTGDAILKMAHVYTDGSNDAKIVIDDSTDGTGTVKLEVQVDASVEPTRHIPLGDGIDFENGFYVTLTGDNATFSLDYKKI